MLNIRSWPGSINSIQYSTNLSHTNPVWIELTKLVVTNASFYQFIDYEAASATHRYYRLVEGTKTNSSVTVSGPTSFTYNGLPQGPTTASVTGSTAPVTWSYAGASGTAYGPSPDRPVNAGSYTATASVGEDNNYKGASSDPLSFTIAKANTSVTVSGSTNFIYDGSPQGPTTATVTGSSNAVMWSYKGANGTTYGPNPVRPINAGSYTATASVGEDNNYKGASSDPLSFTIAKANTSVTVSGPTSFTYDGLPQGPTTATVSGSSNAVTWSYKGANGTTYGSSSTRPINAGSYTATASVAADNNYNAASSGPVPFTIAKANSSVTVSGPASFTYNGSPQGPTNVTVTGSSAAVTWSYAGVSGTAYGPSSTRPVNAGSYTATASVAADNNYNAASSGPVPFTIAKANSSVTVSGPTSFTYNGSPQGPTNAAVAGSTAAVTWSYAGVSGTAYGPSPVRPTNAGSYTATASVAADNNYNAASSSPVPFTILKANSSTVIASSLNPSVFGQPVIFTAAVTAESSGGGTPTGTMQFKTNHINFGNPVPLMNGSASTPPFALLPMGTITVTAQYGGDGNFNSSSGTLAGGQTVKPMLMVIIPSGEFQMGEPGATTGIALEHSVFVNAFLMDSNLVSYTLWTNVYQWAINHGYSFGHAGAGKAANHPVQKVDWYDVVKWCNARSEKDGLTPCYYVSTDLSPANVYRTGTNNLGNSHVNWNANGYRLPTEAEWERAARGGTNGRLFPWATDKISKTRANYFGNTASYIYDEGPDGYHSSYSAGSEPYTSPVGDLKAGRNAYGLYDMAGNVGQWCWDWYGRTYYTTNNNPINNPQGPNTGTARVVRSGSWRAIASSQKCDARDNRAPKTALNTIGFRCVRSH